jgi:hypothetical protein
VNRDFTILGDIEILGPMMGAWKDRCEKAGEGLEGDRADEDGAGIEEAGFFECVSDFSLDGRRRGQAGPPKVADDRYAFAKVGACDILVFGECVDGRIADRTGVAGGSLVRRRRFVGDVVPVFAGASAEFLEDASRRKAFAERVPVSAIDEIGKRGLAEERKRFHRLELRAARLQSRMVCSNEIRSVV